jgi:phage recombination protein Bet
MADNAVAVAGDQKVTKYIPFGTQDAIELTVGMVQKYIANPTKSGVLPDMRQCVRFIALCKAQRLNPFAGDAYLIGFDGHAGPEFSLVTAHQAFLKRAEASGDYDGMESGVTVQCADDGSDLPSDCHLVRRKGGVVIYERQGDMLLEDETLLGAWSCVYRKNMGRPIVRRIALGTFDKGFSQWKANKAGMIVKCAEADGLRSSFPTLLGGLYIEGETARTPVDMGEVELVSHAAPQLTTADRVRGKLAAPAPVVTAGDEIPMGSDTAQDPAPAPKAPRKPRETAKAAPEPAGDLAGFSLPEECPSNRTSIMAALEKAGQAAMDAYWATHDSERGTGATEEDAEAAGWAAALAVTA